MKMSRKCFRCKELTANAGRICALCMDLAEMDKDIHNQIQAIKRKKKEMIRVNRLNVARASYEEWQRHIRTKAYLIEQEEDVK